MYIKKTCYICDCEISDDTHYYCPKCKKHSNTIIAYDLRQRQRRRRELKELLPEVFQAYSPPSDVVGVIILFVGYDLPGALCPLDRDFVNSLRTAIL